MNKKLEKVLIISDPHYPYHNKRAVNLTLKAAKGFKPDHIVVLGDFADFYKISSFSKDPSRSLNLKEEIKEVNKGLDALDKLGAKNKIFIAGNHEDRLRRFLQDSAPELSSLISIKSLFKLRDRGWTYVPYKSDYRLGKVYFTHDVGVAGRYSVFKCLETYQHPVITGHTHRLSYVVEGNAANGSLVSAQFGWLGDSEQQDYLHQARARKDWTLGFGIGYLDPATGSIYLVPVPIINYTCVVEGKYYE